MDTFTFKTSDVATISEFAAQIKKHKEQVCGYTYTNGLTDDEKFTRSLVAIRYTMENELATLPMKQDK